MGRGRRTTHVSTPLRTRTVDRPEAARLLEQVRVGETSEMWAFQQETLFVPTDEQQEIIDRILLAEIDVAPHAGLAVVPGDGWQVEINSAFLLAAGLDPVRRNTHDRKEQRRRNQAYAAMKRRHTDEMRVHRYHAQQMIMEEYATSGRPWTVQDMRVDAEREAARRVMVGWYADGTVTDVPRIFAPVHAERSGVLAAAWETRPRQRLRKRDDALDPAALHMLMTIQDQYQQERDRMPTYGHMPDRVQDARSLACYPQVGELLTHALQQEHGTQAEAISARVHEVLPLGESFVHHEADDDMGIIRWRRNSDD